MEIKFQKAKNEELTALIDGHFIHSNYAPSKEAQRFVDNLKLPFLPSWIIILEPALCYAVDFFKQNFPDIKIAGVRYTSQFSEFDKKLDLVLNYSAQNFKTLLEKSFNEEELLTAFFVSWPASSQIFPDIEKKIWNDIKDTLERAKTLLITREYFEKKWLLNSCRFISSINKIATLKQIIDKDCLIVSSGPSLKPFINLIKNNRQNFFIICLSSAISVCLKENIIPDIFMSTDGGYWAGEHLKRILQKNSIPLAIPSEAYCSKKILHSQTILPLIYNDGFSKELTIASKIDCLYAVRNGTVSGTALLFAAKYCKKNIFMCGLDLAPQKGFQHTQPNELENNSAVFDNRIQTKEKRLSASGFSNASLDIYRQWFNSINLSLQNRKVFRLIEKPQSKNNLGWIQDITVNDFSSFINETTDPDNAEYFTVSSFQPDRKNAALLFSNYDSEKLKKQLFPLDYVSLSHNPDNIEIRNKIEKEWQKLRKKAEGILYGNI